MLPAVTAAPAQLIPIDVRPLDGEDVQTVDARTLHEFLCVGKAFGAWLVERIDKFGFVENVDYVLAETCFPKMESKMHGGHNRRDYALSLSMAKELAMVERTPQGKAARLYFIACERRLKAVVAAPPQPAMPDLSNPAVLLPLLTQYAEKTLALEKTVAAQAPVVFANDGGMATVVELGCQKRGE